jgi:hypothetical protein
MSSQRFTDYLGIGTHAARPAALDLATGCLGIYYETDTGDIHVWNGSIWVQVIGSGITGDVSGPGYTTTGHLASWSDSSGQELDDSGIALSSVVVSGGALGTPSSGTLTNATGLPIGGVTGLGSNVSAFLVTASSANLRAALTDETGTGAAVFATSPTLVTPNLGIPSAIDLTNATNVPTGTIYLDDLVDVVVDTSLAVGDGIIWDGSHFVNSPLTASSSGGFSVVTKTADYAILSGDSGKDFNNSGAGANIVLSLPAAVAGRLYAAAVHDAFYIKFLADGTDKIAEGTDNSAAGGYIRSNLPFSYIELRCHVAGQWVASMMRGSWGIDV